MSNVFLLYPPFFVLALLFGCCSFTPLSTTPVRVQEPTINLEVLRHSYLKVNRSIFVRLCGLTASGETECIDTTPSRATASSIVYRHEDDRTLILTAGHACQPQNEMTIFDYIYNVPQSEGVAQRLAQFIDIRTMEKVTKIELRNISGERFLDDIEVVEVDTTSDLCVLSMPEARHINAVPIAEEDPPIGSVIWNIASPYGIFNIGMVPILRGVWCGRSPSGAAFVCDLPASPGSSGSGVLNNEGEIVSIILATNLEFHQASFGASLEQIRSIID